MYSEVSDMCLTYIDNDVKSLNIFSKCRDITGALDVEQNLILAISALAISEWKSFSTF